MAVAAQAPKGLATIVPQGFGAGVGRVKPYYEQGNWYRGGAVQMLFIDWLMGEQNQVRPTFPRELTQAQLVEAAKAYDLAERRAPVDWSKAFWHLPVKDILTNVGGPRGIFADSMPVATGGRMIQRTPNDPAWYRGGLFHDDMFVYRASRGGGLAQNATEATANGRFGQMETLDRVKVVSKPLQGGAGLVLEYFMT